jgi:hypothetical protein
MPAGEPRSDVTLLDLLIDGFEKNEIMGGFHWRSLPLPDEAAAVRKYASLADEATRWKGEPLRREERDERRLVAWEDLEIRQAGRGVMVRARAPWFDRWWHEPTTWRGNPMGAIFDWIEQERAGSKGSGGGPPMDEGN